MQRARILMWAGLIFFGENHNQGSPVSRRPTPSPPDVARLSDSVFDTRRFVCQSTLLLMQLKDTIKKINRWPKLRYF